MRQRFRLGIPSLVALAMLSLVGTAVISHLACARADSTGGEGATPVYMKFEAEDFAGVSPSSQTDPKVGSWKQNMAWYPQWSRGGDSGWWAVYGEPTAAVGDLSLDTFIPTDGAYTLWVRYEDYAGKPEPFDVYVGQAKAAFGLKDVAPPPTPPLTWNYAWASSQMNLKEGPAKIRIALAGTAPVRRGVDSIILTTDPQWKPADRGFPPMAYSQYLLKWGEKREPLKPLIEADPKRAVPEAWQLKKTAGRDFWYMGATTLVPGFPEPVRISGDDGDLAIKGFLSAHRGNPKAAPIFSLPVVGLQINIADTPNLLRANDPVRQYILKNKRPFVIVGNYGSAKSVPGSFNAMKQTFGELWVGIISGEDSYLGPTLVPPDVAAGKNYKENNYQFLFGAGKQKWKAAISADWASPVENPLEKVITCISVGTVTHVHQFAEAGAQVVGAESASALPYIQWQVSFVRGAARQYGIRWLWYYGASFGDAIRTLTKEGPYEIKMEGLKIDNRNAVIGSSFAHVRRTLLNAYLQGTNFFHPEQGYNLFDNNGKLNAMGWSYDEMLRMASKHPDRGVINTPVGLLLDHAHGWDKYTYDGERIWGKEPMARGDRMLDQFFNVAYFPFPKNEGDPVDDLNVPWPNGYFGDIFDALVTSPTKLDAVKNYPVLICLGETRLDAKWAGRLKQYVNDGGTLVINAEQVVPGLDDTFLGAKLGDAKAAKEASSAQCVRDNETLAGTPFSYRMATATTGEVIAKTPSGDPVAVLNKVGKGKVILTTPSYLLGLDGVAMPYMAHLLLEVTSGLQPVEVRGNCQHFVNIRADGYIVVVSNNEGISKASHSPARPIDQSKSYEITLRTKEKPAATEDWIGEEPQSWAFANEWLPEYTQPVKLDWKQDGEMNTATLKLRPGEIRVFFLKTK